MAEILTLNDETWQKTIGDKPALILLSNGDGLRGDFSTAFKKAASENKTVVFAQIDPAKNPQASETFEAGKKPVLVGWYKDKELVRRSRPWGTDVVLAIEMVEKAYKEDAPPEAAANGNGATEPAEVALAEGTPVNVTDANFQQEVIDFSHKLPVLIDFWADWCQPCKMVAPIVEKMAGEFAGQVRIAKVDVDSNPQLQQAFRIMSIPTIMAFKEGQPVFSQPGAFPEPAFRDLIQQLIALKLPPPGQKTATPQKQPKQPQNN
jgi:thioredoxin